MADLGAGTPASLEALVGAVEQAVGAGPRRSGRRTTAKRSGASASRSSSLKLSRKGRPRLSRLSHGAALRAVGVAFLLVVDHLLVEGEALVVEGVAHLVALGPQVGLVVGVGRRLDRHLLGDREAVALEADDLFRVVGEDADAGQAEVAEDLGADPVVAQVGGQAELEVGLDRVGALLLQLVGAQLVQQADPAPLLGEVEEDAAALALDHRQRRVELLAAVAAHAVEDVAGEALAVDADEHVLGARRPRP